MQSTRPNSTGEKSQKPSGINVQELFGRIKQCVAAGDIETAESLHEALMAADTMALKQIVASAELIDKAKVAGIEKDHLRIWDELYEMLSSEEKGIFFYSLVEKTLPPKSILLSQGSLNDRLFFIEQGHVAAIFTKEKINNLVLQVGKGGFVGEDTFFGMSVCTSSVVAESKVVVKILTKESVREWVDTAPGLYTKLESFCRLHDRYEDAYQIKRQEKSRFQRVPVSGVVSADILNSEMKPTGKHFKASIGDVSRGGACFFIKSSRKEVAGSLLAKPLRMIFSIEDTDDLMEFMAIGNVVRIRFHMENDYSVHVKFSSPIGKEKLELLQES
ncbi:MAG TPA: cyclic nucleotide-binding domain-containing protein [Desulfobacterales bacterium]|nr:cyclic nucleotide-binding domain-containing protein [Desulfobacterales bacterium]